MPDFQGEDNEAELQDQADPILPHEVQLETAAEAKPAPADGQLTTLLTSAHEDMPSGGKRTRRSVRSRLNDGAPGEARHPGRSSSSTGAKGEHHSGKPGAEAVLAGQGPFYEMLGHLAEQHEAELEKLRAENAALSAQLRSHDILLPSPPPEGDPPEAPALFGLAPLQEQSAAPAEAPALFGLAPPPPGQGAVHWGNVERRSISKEPQANKDSHFLLPPRRKSVSEQMPEVPQASARRPSLSVNSGMSQPARRHSIGSGITQQRRMSRKSIGSQNPGLSLALQLSQIERIEVLPVWEEKETQRAKIHRRMSTQSTHPMRMSKVRQIDNDKSESVVRDDVNVYIVRCLGKLIMHPSSLKRLFWDVLGFTFLSYDIMHIPFASAFEPGETSFTETMSGLTLYFWTLDMLASIMTGFQKGGVTVMVHKQIFIRYMTTWFPLDAFIIGLDWVMLFIYEGDHNAGEAIRQGRSLRMLRYVRTVRLIRLFKLKKLFHEIQDHLNTELLSTVFSILKTVVGLVVANHLIACAWYAMGIAGEAGQPSWVRANDLEDRTIAYKYTTSLHWSLTQFTPASMEIRPYNEVERIFSVFVVLLALVSFSSFVSTLTASISRLSAMRSNEYRQFWLLRRYLRDLGISRQLSLRVQRYCEYAWERHHQSVQERDVLLLQHLSEPLREELKAETFAPHLSIHPLIEQLQDCVRRFSSALTAVEIAKGDQVFGYGEEAHNMLFVARGELQYSVGTDEDESMEALLQHDAARADAKAAEEESDEDSEDSEMSDVVESVFESDWVSEAALWTQWDHLGYLEALTDCQLVAIRSSVFSEVVSQNAATWSSAQKYAKKFVEHLNQVDRRKLTDVLERNLTFLAAKEIGCVGFSPIRSSSAIIRKRDRRKGFGVSEYRLRYGTRRFLFRVQLAAQSAMHGLRRFCRRQ